MRWLPPARPRRRRCGSCARAFPRRQKREGASIKHDISVPVAAIPDFLAKAVPAVLALVPGARPVSFGHLGDGNLHFNFNSPQAGDDPAFLAQWEEVQQTVHDIVKEFGGSISAEHGIGVMKRGAPAPLQIP